MNLFAKRAPKVAASDLNDPVLAMATACSAWLTIALGPRRRACLTRDDGEADQAFTLAAVRLSHLLVTFDGRPDSGLAITEALNTYAETAQRCMERADEIRGELEEAGGTAR